MANIKGITIQLGADTTKLTDALRKVNSKIRNTQSDLREVTNNEKTPSFGTRCIPLEKAWTKLILAMPESPVFKRFPGQPR